MSNEKDITAYGMSETSTGELSFNGEKKKIQVIEQNRTITPGNPQEYYINNPENNFEIEIYHLPTQKNIIPIFSTQVNMTLL